MTGSGVLGREDGGGAGHGQGAAMSAEVLAGPAGPHPRSPPSAL